MYTILTIHKVICNSGMKCQPIIPSSLARQGGLEVDSEVVNSSDNLGVESQTDNDDTDAGIRKIKSSMAFAVARVFFIRGALHELRTD